MHLLFPLMSAKQDEPNIMECRTLRTKNIMIKTLKKKTAMIF